MAAKAYELVLRQRLARGEPLVSSQRSLESFAHFAAEWFQTYVRSNNKPSEQYSKAIALRRHLVPFFGRLLLSEIDGERIEHYKATRHAGALSPKTINNHLTILRKSLACARDWGRIDRIPEIKWLRVSLPPVRVLTPEESGLLLADRSDLLGHTLFVLALYTGMRLGELLGLDWSDIDFDHDTILIRRSLVRGTLGTPKNGRSRLAALPRCARDLLRTEQAPASGFVFQRPSGEPLTGRMAYALLHRMCRRAGVTPFGWHTLRHTCATRLAERYDLPLVQEHLGHSSVITTRRYTHVAPDRLHQAVAYLESLEHQRGQQAVNAPPFPLPSVPIPPITPVPFLPDYRQKSSVEALRPSWSG